MGEVLVVLGEVWVVGARGRWAWFGRRKVCAERCKFQVAVCDGVEFTRELLFADAEVEVSGPGDVADCVIVDRSVG